MSIDLNQPQVMAAIVGGGVAAVVSLIVAVVNQLSLRSMHREKLGFDRDLAERRNGAELALAERKFEHDRAMADRKAVDDQALAERRFKYDQDFAIWKRRTELAEETLSDFSKARDVIGWARFPVSFENEGATRVRGEDETEDQARYRNSLYVPVERLSHENELFSRLMATRYRFQANFGPETAPLFDELRAIRNEIVSAAHHLIGDRREQPPSALRDRWEAAIGWGLQDEDPIASRLDAVMVAMEAVCRPILGHGVRIT